MKENKIILAILIIVIWLGVVPALYFNTTVTKPIKYHLATYHDTVWVYNNNNVLIGRYVSKQNETLDSVLSNYNQ